MIPFKIPIYVLAILATPFLMVFVIRRAMKKTDNFGPEEAKKCCIDLVFYTEKTVKIITDLTPKFFNDEDILFSFQDALNRGVTFKVLHDPSVDYGKLKKFLRLVHDNEDKIMMKKMAKRPPYHFWVCDRNHIRLEHPHEPFDLEQVKGSVRYNTLGLGQKYERFFNQLWRMETHP